MDADWKEIDDFLDLDDELDYDDEIKRKKSMRKKKAQKKKMRKRYQHNYIMLSRIWILHIIQHSVHWFMKMTWLWWEVQTTHMLIQPVSKRYGTIQISRNNQHGKMIFKKNFET